jgi:uncharacterized protein YbjQ (UPF0145 family)
MGRIVYPPRAEVFSMRAPQVLLVFALVATSGCTPLAYQTRFDRIGLIASTPAAQPIVASPRDVKLYYASAPPGFSLRDNELKVEPGYTHRILGRVQVLHGGGYCDLGPLPAAGRSALLEAMQQRAHAAGANAAIYVQSELEEGVGEKEVCRLANEMARARVLNTRPWAEGWAVVIGAP